MVNGCVYVCKPCKCLNQRMEGVDKDGRAVVVVVIHPLDTNTDISRQRLSYAPTRGGRTVLEYTRDNRVKITVDAIFAQTADN